MVTTQTVTFDIPADLWLSANGRLHWAAKAKRVKMLRSLGWAKACAAGLRHANLGCTHVAAYIGYPRAGRADPSNAADTIKPLIDGMTDAGVWADDDHLHVLGPTFLRDKPSGTKGVHTVRLVLTDQEIPF